MNRELVRPPFDFSVFPEVFRRWNTGVYAIVNLSRLSAYVGATNASFGERWRVHQQQLDSGQHDKSMLHRHWVTDGRHTFKFLILQELKWSKSMVRYEQFWLDELRAAGVSCYNGQSLAERFSNQRGGALEGYYRLREVSSFCGVSYSTAYRWILRGVLEGCCINGHWHVPIPAVDELLRTGWYWRT